MASRYKTPADFNQRNKRNIEHLNNKEQKDTATAIITEATLIDQPENGAEINIKNNKGATALLVAAYTGDTEIVNILFRKRR